MISDIKALSPIDYTLYYGIFLDTPKLGELRIRFNTLIGVDKQGVINYIDEDYSGEVTSEKIKEHFLSSRPLSEPISVVISDSFSSFFVPGFIDTHIHASQFPNIGIGLGVPLLDWLQKYTFPLESELNSKNLDLVEKVYSQVIRKTLLNGTTYASYFTTIDPVSTNILTDLLLKFGQRGSVGKVCMDDNQLDNSYEEDYHSCVTNTKRVVDYIANVNQENNTLVKPIITPRFAPTCSEELLSFLGEFADEKNFPIQTHISENIQEIELVKNLFPNCKSYADVYDKFNLLTENTILAHAVYLNQFECNLLKEKNCSISHCPTSNTFLSSGEAPIKKYLYEDGINIALGTDVSGGFETSVLKIIKHSILVSHHLAMKSENSESRLSINDGIYMATQGGAKAVGLSDVIGSFDVGKKFDTQKINLESNGSNISIFDWQLPQSQDDEKMKTAKFVDLLGKWIFNGDDRNCTTVWCNGRAVIDKSF